ncbi:transglutaminase-like cysteine peptidase [Thermodesulfobacteriota bacterium]
MSYRLLQKIIKYITRNFSLLVTPFLIVLILFFMSGCGAKKKAAEEAFELAPEKERILTPAQKRVAAWHALMREKRGAPEMEMLKSVNSFFNNLEFVDDLYLWGTEDYWATPQEMLTINGGDCEDFATAKYFTLRHLEIPDEKMRLTYVKSLTFEQPHMVLSFYQEPTAEPLILDSLVDAILTASKRPDLLPIYSFNGQGLWLTRKQSSDRLRGSDNLSLWQELRQRFTQEAIAAPLPE